jgi:hypothetical protein
MVHSPFSPGAVREYFLTIVCSAIVISSETGCCRFLLLHINNIYLKIEEKMIGAPKRPHTSFVHIEQSDAEV